MSGEQQAILVALVTAASALGLEIVRHVSTARAVGHTTAVNLEADIRRENVELRAQVIAAEREKLVLAVELARCKEQHDRLVDALDEKGRRDGA